MGSRIKSSSMTQPHAPTGAEQEQQEVTKVTPTCAPALAPPCTILYTHSITPSLTRMPDTRHIEAATCACASKARTHRKACRRLGAVARPAHMPGNAPSVLDRTLKRPCPTYMHRIHHQHVTTPTAIRLAAVCTCTENNTHLCIKWVRCS